MTLGEIINDYRTKNSLSMDAFSAKSGISKAYISLLEKKSTSENWQTNYSFSSMHKASI